MGGAQAGQTTKKLKLTPMQDEKGYIYYNYLGNGTVMYIIQRCSLFLSLVVSDKTAAPVSISLPVSWGEIQVLKTLIDYCIPRFLGLDNVWSNTMEQPEEGLSA
jgi:hypothetical protein